MPAKKTTRKTTAKRATKKPAAKRATSRAKTSAKRAPAARKTTARKTTAAKKTSTSRKTTAATKTAPKKPSAIKSPFSKTQMQTAIAEATDLTRKQVSAVFDFLGDIIESHVKARAAGEFTLPGLLKVKVVRKPATKARKGINPFTGEETVFKAKPARNVVKIKALKKLKDMVA